MVSLLVMIVPIMMTMFLPLGLLLLPLPQIIAFLWAGQTLCA
jgi:hypothetical protein